MTRSTILAATACALLAACGTPAAENAAGNAAAPEAVTVEDVPSDSLAAPANLQFDSESGNAM